MEIGGGKGGSQCYTLLPCFLFLFYCAIVQLSLSGSVRITVLIIQDCPVLNNKMQFLTIMGCNLFLRLFYTKLSPPPLADMGTVVNSAAAERLAEPVLVGGADEPIESEHSCSTTAGRDCCEETMSKLMYNYL